MSVLLQNDLEIINEANKHKHSFIVYCTSNDYMNIYSNDGLVIYFT